jgi:iron(III) transport system ATP-binding protein
MIAGLERATEGSIWIDGVDVTARGAAERNVSMVFQSYALFPHMSVIENVRYGLDSIGCSREEAAQRAQQALARVGLVGLDLRLPAELSGGQQQRVALARALVLEPSVLLFDEPLSNLDARLRRSMRDEIRRLQRQLELTVVYVTHDQAEALAISDQIIIMEGGRIAQSGDARTLYARPATAFVAQFLGEAALYPGECDGMGGVKLGSLRLSAVGHAAGPVWIAIRPEAWGVEPLEKPPETLDAVMPTPESPRPRAEGTIEATLEHFAWLGAIVELHFSTPVGAVFAWSTATARNWLPGARYVLSLAGAGYSILAHDEAPVAAEPPLSPA